MDLAGRKTNWRSGARSGVRIGALLVVAASVEAVPTAAVAQTPTAAVLAAPCASCHGTGGASAGAIPSIDRLDAAAIVARMRAFRSAGTEVTIMNRIAKGYTDLEIELLSQYFAAGKR